jgi:hypothetical protein
MLQHLRQLRNFSSHHHSHYFCHAWFIQTPEISLCPACEGSRPEQILPIDASFRIPNTYIETLDLNFGAPSVKISGARFFNGFRGLAYEARRRERRELEDPDDELSRGTATCSVLTIDTLSLDLLSIEMLSTDTLVLDNRIALMFLPLLDLGSVEVNFQV